jgi:hypothetical protein
MLQSPWNPAGTGFIDNMLTKKDGKKLAQEKKQQNLLRTAITASLELLPKQTEIMIQHNTPVNRTV